MGHDTLITRLLQPHPSPAGASALDKRAHKAWAAATLAKLGASADKAPRMAARIGQGVARKAKEREAKAAQEAIEAGMLSRQELAKKRRVAERAKAGGSGGVDTGLQEAGRGFKGGVLRIAHMKKQRGDGGGGGATRVANFAGIGGKGKRKGGGGKKCGAKKGGKKGGKRR